MALTFGAAVANKRKALDLSQKELSAKIEISPQYLNDIERGRRYPSESLIPKFAEVLELDENTLFYLANHIPVELRGIGDLNKIKAGFKAFRNSMDKKN